MAQIYSVYEQWVEESEKVCFEKLYLAPPGFQHGV
jgi:hypothetical protein